MPITYTPKTGRQIYDDILKPAYNKHKGARRASLGQVEVMNTAKTFLTSDTLNNQLIQINDESFFNLIQIFELSSIKMMNESSKARHKALNALLVEYKIDFNNHIQPLIDNNLLTMENWAILYESNESFPQIQSEKVNTLILAYEKNSSITREEKKSALKEIQANEKVRIDFDPNAPIKSPENSFTQNLREKTEKLLTKLEQRTYLEKLFIAHQYDLSSEGEIEAAVLDLKSIAEAVSSYCKDKPTASDDTSSTPHFRQSGRYKGYPINAIISTIEQLIENKTLILTQCTKAAEGILKLTSMALNADRDSTMRDEASGYPLSKILALIWEETETKQAEAFMFLAFAEIAEIQTDSTIDMVAIQQLVTTLKNAPDQNISKIAVRARVPSFSELLEKTQRDIFDQPQVVAKNTQIIERRH
jgi:hypothetical protein